MIADPKRAVAEGWIKLAINSKIQQSGIDVTLRKFWNLFPENMYTDSLILRQRCSYGFECYEYIRVPRNYCALLIVRSSLNRQGAFITTGLYDNGFKGFIGGTIHVMGSAVRVRPLDRIGQIYFMKCEHEAQYDGQYQDKKGEQ